MDPSDTIAREGIHLRRGKTALAVGRHQEALREAVLAIAESPRDASAHALLAGTLTALGRHKEALKAADAGLAVAADAEHLHRLRAHALNALRRRKAALASAREALRLAPAFAETHFMMASVLFALKRFDEAHDCAAAGARLQPTAWEGPALTGDVALRRRQWAVAEEHYRRSLSIEPRHALLLNALGVALVGQGKEADGLHAFRAAVAVDPRLPHAKRNAWIMVHGSPGLITHDWRSTAAVGAGIVALGLGGTMLSIYTPWALVPVVGALTAWVLFLRRARRARLARLQEDPALRELLERIERDADARPSIRPRARPS